MSSVISKIRIEPGFSAQELKVDIDREKMNQLNVQIKSIEVEADADVKLLAKSLRYKLAESLLTEIQHYKALQEYKDKLTPEFIAAFNEAEQTFLCQLLAVLNEYLQQQQRYVNELLSLAGYTELDAFSKELAEIPEVAAAISGNIELDLFSKLVKVMGIKRGDMVGFLAKKLQDETVDPSLGVDDKVARFLPIAQRNMTDNADLPLRLFVHARIFDNMQAYYSASTLEQDAQKRAQFASKKTATQVGNHTLSSLIVKMVTNERELMFNDMAKAVDKQWALATGEKIAECVERIRLAVKKNALQIYEAMGDISQVSTVAKAPRNLQKPDGVKPTALSQVEGLEDPVAPDESIQTHSPELPRRRINSEPMPKDKVLEKREAQPARMSGLGGSESIGKLIDKTKVIGETVVSGVQSAVQALFRQNDEPKRKVVLEATVPLMSFTEHAQMAVETIRTFQEIEKQYKDASNLAPEKRVKIEGWQAIYKRRKIEQTDEDQDQSVENLYDTTPSDGFRAGDSVEVLHKGKTVFEIMPAEENNETRGVKVTIPVDGHNEENIEVTVLYMVRSLAKKGQKEVFIGIDLNLPGSDELALLYAKTILGKNAIPVFKLEGKKLSRKETQEKLKEIYSRITDETVKNKYKKLVEQYGCKIEMVESQQKEDTNFLRAFEKFMGLPNLTVNSYMKSSSAKKKLTKKEIISTLGKIALIYHNLTEDEFVDKLVDYVQKTQANQYVSLAKDDLDKVKAQMRFHLASLMAKEPNISAEELAAKIFDLSLTKIKSKLFLNAFDKFVQELESSSAIDKIGMQDPNTGENLDIYQILTQLVVHSEMEKEVFVERITAFGLATLAPSVRAAVADKDMDDLKKELREKVRFHLLHSAEKRDEAVFAADLIRKMQDSLFLKVFDNFLRNIELPSGRAEAKMQDPQTGEELDTHEILTRLTKITFVGNMTQEDFIDRALAFGLATLAPSVRAAVTQEDIDDLKKALRKKVTLHMDHRDSKRDDGLFVAHLIEFAQNELIPGNTSKVLSGRNAFISGMTCAASIGGMASDKKDASEQSALVMVRNG